MLQFCICLELNKNILSQKYLKFILKDNYKYFYDPKMYLPAKKQLVKQQPIVIKSIEDEINNSEDKDSNKKIVIEKLNIVNKIEVIKKEFEK